MKETKSKKPCKGCPFLRVNTNEKHNPGGSSPEVYLGQTRGPFWLPCHEDKNYSGKESNPEKVSQCRGAAIFRANCGLDSKLPDQLLKLDKDSNLVFSNENEFYAHYYDLDPSKINLNSNFLDYTLKVEFDKFYAIKKQSV